MWQIEISRESLKFLQKENVAEEEIFDLARRAVRKFQGEEINVDARKLHGEWRGFYRIRKGKLRIILEFRFEEFSIYIERIDWRGGAYWSFAY